MAKQLTPPPLQGPSAKEKKYDRQLRLWGANGQEALENSHVLLIHGPCAVVGAESLKNLVLPGIGSFTIVDEYNVEEEDLGVNFFLEKSSLGKPRAEELCRLLCELNPAVKGHAIQKTPEDFLHDSDLSKYTLILLASPIRFQPHKDALEMAFKLSIPLFHIHSMGFYSHFSVQLPPLFPVVETHPDPESTQDLRLLKPWPALVELAEQKTANLESMTDYDHGHVPYLLLLLHFLEEWKKTHEGKTPSVYKEKTEFRSLVRSHARTDNAEGGEENFDEATAAILKSISEPSIPSGLKDIFNTPECKNLTVESENFWIISSALSAFVASHGVLPLPGPIPDMKAQSKEYVRLQTIYRKKAQDDLAEVTDTVRKIEADVGRSEPAPAKEIEAFCKGAAFVKLIRGGGFNLAPPDAKTDWAGKEKVMIRELQDPESLMGMFLAVRAFDYAYEALVEKDGRSIDALMAAAKDPSKLCKAMNERVERVVTDLAQYDSEMDVADVTERLQKHVKEVCRSGPGELHNISSVTGGMVAQEAIKVLTKQYVPIENSCLYDGITSKTATVKV